MLYTLKAGIHLLSKLIFEMISEENNCRVQIIDHGYLPLDVSLKRLYIYR